MQGPHVQTHINKLHEIVLIKILKYWHRMFTVYHMTSCDHVQLPLTLIIPFWDEVTNWVPSGEKLQDRTPSLKPLSWEVDLHNIVDHMSLLHSCTLCRLQWTSSNPATLEISTADSLHPWKFPDQRDMAWFQRKDIPIASIQFWVPSVHYFFFFWCTSVVSSLEIFALAMDALRMCLSILTKLKKKTG